MGRQSGLSFTAFLSLPFLATALLASCKQNVDEEQFASAKVRISLESVYPVQGAHSGGTTLTLVGSAFDPDMTVLVGGSPCSNLIFFSDELIGCMSAPHDPGYVDVKVIGSDGASSTLPGGFEYLYPPADPPRVTAINPNSGPVTGGQTVTITGENFMAGATVTVGGVTCLSPTVVSATSITCSTNMQLKGPGSVAVTNPDRQTAALANAYTFTGMATFSVLKSRVFGNRCGRCHDLTGPTGNLSIMVYDQVRSRVVPMNPAGSLIYQRIVSTGNDRMPPPANAAALGTIERESVADWINAGALDN